MRESQLSFVIPESCGEDLLCLNSSYTMGECIFYFIVVAAQWMNIYSALL